MVVAELEPGSYPVAPSIVHWESSPSSRPLRSRATAAAVVVGGAPVESWEPVRADADRSTEALGFSVHAGTGCFADESSIHVLQHLQSNERQMLTAIEQVTTNLYVAPPEEADAASLVLFDVAG